MEHAGGYRELRARAARGVRGALPCMAAMRATSCTNVGRCAGSRAMHALARPAIAGLAFGENCRPSIWIATAKTTCARPATR